MIIIRCVASAQHIL